MPQFCRKRKRTEIRDRLKGVISIVAVVDQEQNIKSKGREKCKVLHTKYHPEWRVSAEVPVVMPSLTPTWQKSQVLFPSAQLNTTTHTEQKPNMDSAYIALKFGPMSDTLPFCCSSKLSVC